MTKHIIETVGSWGVKTNPFSIRGRHPSPGDPVNIQALDFYPYKGHEWASIAAIHGSEVSLCIGIGSMFLNQSGNVSISGGPFTAVGRPNLEATMRLKRMRFWNWGDNGTGAGHGVDYYIDRPVFDLVGVVDDYA